MDSIQLNLSPRTQLEIGFEARSIVSDYRWQTDSSDDDLTMAGDDHFVMWNTYRNEESDVHQILLPSIGDNQWQMSLGSGRQTYGRGKSIDWPYATTILTLTLLSALLILWPRRNTQ
jgi:hypothetical protein